MYDICFIGSGTATTFALLQLVKNNYKGKVLILEKGSKLEDRTEKDVMEGAFGSGMFSDSKIIRSLKSNFITGGDIYNYIDNNSLVKLDTDFFSTLKKYLPEDQKLETISPKTKQKFDPFKVLYNETIHLGTQWGRVVGKNIYDFLLSQENFNFKFKISKFDLKYINGSYKLYFKNGDYFETSKIVVATGRSGANFVEKLSKQFKLNTEESELQIGIRVEVPFEITKKFTDSFYDFKFILEKPDSEIRSFCVSPQGEVIEENLYNELVKVAGK
jgi:uncharacterized FAD-dependent dehydrogenase